MFAFTVKRSTKIKTKKIKKMLSLHCSLINNCTMVGVLYNGRQRKWYLLGSYSKKKTYKFLIVVVVQKLFDVLFSRHRNDSKFKLKLIE